MFLCVEVHFAQIQVLSGSDPDVPVVETRHPVYWPVCAGIRTVHPHVRLLQGVLGGTGLCAGVPLSHHGHRYHLQVRKTLPTIVCRQKRPFYIVISTPDKSVPVKSAHFTLQITNF